MYCSSCGTTLAQGLSYCNRCGVKLNAAKSDGVSKSAELFPDSLVWAIVTVFILGIGSIMGLAAIMKRVLDSNDGMINTAMLGIFLLMLVIESVFVWMLVQAKRRANDAGKELKAGQVHLLTEPAPSVTEHTTRTLEPSRREEETRTRVRSASGDL
jgi:uncharacterized paraquat-inducible protein A